MIIIPNITDKFTIKIPNNLEKSSELVLHLKNMETKKEYDLDGLTDTSRSGLVYIFEDVLLDVDPGEYEYEIDGNTGLIRVENPFGKKVYDSDIEFKSYEHTVSTIQAQ